MKHAALEEAERCAQRLGFFRELAEKIEGRIDSLDVTAQEDPLLDEVLDLLGFIHHIVTSGLVVTELAFPPEAIEECGGIEEARRVAQDFQTALRKAIERAGEPSSRTS